VQRIIRRDGQAGKSSSNGSEVSLSQPLRATIAALCANLVGIGLARFGYPPLIPALIAAGWFRPSDAVYLGAANLAGYLAGALGAQRLSVLTGARATLRGAMLLTAISLAACAFPLGFGWYFVWRFISGCTGGVLMAQAAPTVMPAIPPERRGVVGGVIFTGVGLGIAASGTLVPALMQWGLVETWLGLGVTAAVLTVVAWNGWPAAQPLRRASTEPQPRRRSSRLLLALYVEYALDAVGLVPHMVFLVDFIARGLDRGLGVGAQYWIVFGAGALVGPVIGGYLGDRVGFRTALRLAFLLPALCVALPLVSVSAPALAISSFVLGAAVPGTVAIANGRTRELVPDDPAGQGAAWGLCTTSFAMGQALAGYGFSWVFAHSDHSYPILFASAAAALLLALAIDIGVGRSTPRAASGGSAA
jgi:predicted MFS family arabinose efflux permease